VYCLEPFRAGHEDQHFCVTCDEWFHLWCLEKHARCEPDGERDWRHLGRIP